MPRGSNTTPLVVGYLTREISRFLSGRFPFLTENKMIIVVGLIIEESLKVDI